MERIRSRPTLWWETRRSGDVDDRSALDLDSLHLGLALCHGLPLPHNRKRRLKLDRTRPHRPPRNLATRQAAPDRRELALAARREKIEGIDERVGKVQMAVGYREEAVERHEEAVGRWEVEERKKAAERREREVREREEKAAELEQTIDERERAIDQRGSELEERSNRFEDLEEGTDMLFLDLVVSTPPFRHLARIHGLLLFFGLSPFMCWVTRRLHPSFALALPPPLTQVFPPTQILPLPPPPPPPPQSPLNGDPDAARKPDAIYTSQQVDEGVTS